MAGLGPPGVQQYGTVSAGNVATWNSAGYIQDGGAGSSSLVVGTTTITGGTTTRVLYDNAGVVGEYTISGSGTVVAMATSPVFTTPTLGVASGTSLALGSATNALTVGPGATYNSTDPMVTITRDVSNATGSGNAHGFSDSTNIWRNSGGPIGYAAYDARGSIVAAGGYNYDHVAAFQAAWTYNSAGTITWNYGLYSKPSVLAGTTTNLAHLYIANPTKSGGGTTIGTQYGLYIESLTGAALNYAVYSAHTGPAQFSGSLTGTTLTATAAGGVNAGSTYLFFNSSTTFHNRSDGVLTLSNFAENDFGRLQLGGTTSSFPAIKRSSAALAFRLADDSADAAITAASISTSTAATFHTTSIALTDGAGASAGTITNAPSVGNPTKWIGINDNGTTRYIPAW